MNEKEKCPVELPSGEMDDLILMLNDIKRRIVDCDKKMEDYPEEYKEKLAEVDALAIEKAILYLREAKNPTKFTKRLAGFSMNFEFICEKLSQINVFCAITAYSAIVIATVAVVLSLLR